MGIQKEGMRKRYTRGSERYTHIITWLLFTYIHTHIYLSAMYFLHLKSYTLFRVVCLFAGMVRGNMWEQRRLPEPKRGVSARGGGCNVVVEEAYVISSVRAGLGRRKASCL
ncbi:hypothetical protein QR685DRAFT_103289 [Neurospora intermedia]|uniref:Uncharacterized protein n=1 Tax=Neurospora intermedia TaxID=5142 RepID=A0ABR3D1X5_NEUIN